MCLDIIATQRAVRLDGRTCEAKVVAVRSVCTFRDGEPNRLDGMRSGLYVGEKEYHFCVGSHFYYDNWRDWLAYSFFGVKAEEVWRNHRKLIGKPFVELIDFSDCQGTIGPKTSAKLYQDFREYRQFALFSTYVDESEKYETYLEFMKAFRLARDGGFVTFS